MELTHYREKDGETTELAYSCGCKMNFETNEMELCGEHDVEEECE